MKRGLGDDIELDDDVSRVDVDAVHAELTTAYWSIGRTRRTVERLVGDATRVVGLYDGHRQVGFCRVVSDGEKFAWLADVYVLQPYRGRGLGVELVREAVENGPHADLAWYLNTRDAHGLYERFGFGPPDPERLMVRPPRRPTSDA
jgi:GNAT superfamily N-acetyltransferase